jgi:hypothetical protein
MPRKHRHNVLQRIFIDSIPIEGGGYKAHVSLIKIIILIIALTAALVVLQYCGALPVIAKMIGAIFS